ncbi:MAG: acetyl-CoA carboxylase carboxyl transferase subunit alpha, partial [Treponema sp.]|nr:acetyl-CoA carboxylase carboxyl transferase subunit alpha [Treponema sp.]
SPRGFASILWKDGEREKEAAELMKICAEDLLAFGICDAIIAEPPEGAKSDIPLTAKNIGDYLLGAVKKYSALDSGALLEKRYQKFRVMGEFTE